jgi:hypothetical protein
MATGTGVRAGGVVDAVRDGADSRPMNWAARLGLAARGMVYLLIGVLAVIVARGGRAEVDQKGALQQVMARPLGGFLVALLALGFACYGLWRLSEATFGVVGEGRKLGPRLRSLARGVVYLFLAVMAVTLLLGAQGSQAVQQTEITARVMHASGGRLVVGLVGLVVVVTGVVLAYEGCRLRFMKYFPQGQLSEGVRTGIKVLGAVGSVARGLVFALAGVLLVVAAWTYDARKAAGLDGALRTLRDQPFGPLLLTVVGLGLVAFGIYGLAEARYRRV